MEQVDIIAEGLHFPEGPVVMPDGSCIVVELAAGRITRCWNGRKEVIAQPGGGPNGAAIGPDGALYVCNAGGLDLERFQSRTGPGAEGRIERIDLATGKVERLYERCGDLVLSAPNDLVFDSAGGLWFTDLGKRYNRLAETGGLYHCQADGSAITPIFTHPISYNGVGLSPDGGTVYVADSFQARLYAFAAKAEKQRPRLIATAPGMVELDSLAVTAAGHICVGTLRQGGITTFTPDGQSRHQPFDDPFVTNIAFGGEDMRDAWITLSTSGRLIRTRWDEPGLRLAFNA
ncbi:SMP-30/gluconolactonase/LRE family protein [Sphingobium sp. Sx8-8]|uniref:SMP-30/gluconolactonase/LRE family protein n=1 Tax=Sphingobium sp. Sx8-8 TaxID=2933617 RepID=UPI001F58B468|nr:SMP-30/gluconolactonase/LRE family protein [Sphingobium sp. Sx8-8]